MEQLVGAGTAQTEGGLDNAGIGGGVGGYGTKRSATHRAMDSYIILPLTSQGETNLCRERSRPTSTAGWFGSHSSAWSTARSLVLSAEDPAVLGQRLAQINTAHPLAGFKGLGPAHRTSCFLPVSPLSCTKSLPPPTFSIRVNCYACTDFNHG